jgi:acyl carrier protein
MEKKVLLIKLTTIFRDIMDDEDIILTDSTCADDIDDWDSLTNIQLIVAIEKEFGIKIKSGQILSWGNVGDMIDDLLEEINSRV